MSEARTATDAGRVAAFWATLDTDLEQAPSETPASLKRICIATLDILGPIKNGGIGTAYHHVARMLAAWGHEVVIAYVNANAADAERMAAARDLYAGFGVAFEPIAPRPGDTKPLMRVPAPTWALLDWLRARERPFDIVHVSEWQGLGYGPLLAKHLGLDFGTTHFVVKGSSPTLWSLEGNRQLVSTEAQLGWVFMERRSVELADTVICGSAHLLDWMRDAGYDLPARAFVWPNVFPAPDPDPAAAAARAARDGAPLREVVFFGRLEPRKGLVLFADAVSRLARQGRAPARITFLGKLDGNFDALTFIERAAAGWPGEVRRLTGYGATEAVAYLAAEPGRLAVIPSLLENASIAVTECLQAGIPFVAAATGGTPELVDPADHDRALVAPDHISLGDRLAELAAAPPRAVRPRRDFAAALDVWERWHAQTAPFAAAAEGFAARARAVTAATPRVTVCLVHHERPALLRMAADSVLAQDYGNLHAVLVDDGSESPAARAALDAVEADFAPRGWRVVRQENRYLGAARNAAAAAAEGEWLLFLDDDNVLFPDAVSRLVRAAHFSGADCVPAASISFTGDGDPRTDAASHDATIRFLGAARAWSHISNVVGDACALVHRDAFEAVGGFTDVYQPVVKVGERAWPGRDRARRLNSYGDGQETGRATRGAAVGDDGGFADERGASVLRASEPGSGRGRVRRVRRGAVRGVLRDADGAAEPASWAVFPDAVHRLLRGSVFGAWDCVAGGRLSEPAVVPGPGCDRGGAGPLDAVADASSDRRRDARGGIHVGSRAVVGGGSGQGEDGGRRCDDAGSERGDAEHRAAGHGRKLRSVPSALGGGVWGGDPDAGGSGSVRPVSQEQEDVEQGLAIAAGPGREDREDEGRPDALGSQGRARGRHGDGGHRVGDGAGCIGRRYGHAAGDADRGGRAGGVGAAGRSRGRRAGR